MLIGFDASRAFVNEATGTENYSKNLLLALAKVDRKNSYRVYLRYQKGKKYQKYQKGFPDNFEFVPVFPKRLWTQVGVALETWRNPVNLLFVPAHTLPILKNPKVKGVVTIHDLGVEYLPAYHKFPQRYYLDLASKFAASTAEAIIAVSKATKADLVHRYKVDPKRVFVVHEGVDTSFFRPRSKEEVKSKKLKFKIGGNYILYVGTVQPRKNLETLIKSFEILVHSGQFTVDSKKQKKGRKDTVNREPLAQNLSLVIAGKLGWDYQPILDLPKKLGIGDRVKFLGYVDREDLPALYSGATVFAFPSLFEGFGLPILEALACECHVIASDIAVHKEIREMVVRDQRPVSKKNQQETGKESFANAKWTLETIPEAMVLAKVDDVDEWAGFLYQSITLSNKKPDFRAIRARLTSKFSWLDTAKSTLKVFGKVLG